MSVSYNAIKSIQNSRNQTMPVVTSVSKSTSGGVRDERGGVPNPPMDPSARYLNTQRAVHSQYVMQLLQLQRRTGFLCDITIHVRDRSFKAHKPLLAACSLYFRSLFGDPAIKDSAALDLNILTPSGFEVLLDYIYSGSLAITAENSTEVLSAATCLQMTNVVETCLNFMHSSFRMCRSTEAQQQNQIMANGLDAFSPNKWPPGVAVPSPHRAMAPPSKLSPMSQMKALPAPAVGPPSSVVRPNPVSGAPQDNLQILSAGSINEAEFKSMIEKSSVPPTPPTVGLVNGDPAGGGVESLPSTSQLQSVLPLLLTKEARQPTLQEVQQFLSALPHSDTERRTTWGNSRDVMQPQMTPMPQIPVSQISHHQNDTLRTSSSDLQPVNNLPYPHQPKPSLPTHSDVTKHAARIEPSIDELPAVSSSASQSAPEQYSGVPVPVASMQHQEVACKKRRTTSDLQTGGEESDPDNNLEISDDEASAPGVAAVDDDGGGFTAWSADRSDEQQDTPTDLSGTPCRATAQLASTPPGGEKTRAALVTGGAVESPDLGRCGLGVKSASAPSSPSKGWMRKVRATSTLSDTTDLHRSFDQANTGGESPDERARASSPTTILTKAIRTSLLPPRSSATPQHPTSSSENDDLGPGSIKIELLSDEEMDAVSGGFPVQDDVTKHADVADDASTVSNSLSRSSVACYDSPGKARSNFDDSYGKEDVASDEDLALDLSMPQRVRALRSSEESDPRALDEEEGKGFPLPLIRTPSQVSERTNHGTESESEMGFRSLEQQDAFGGSDLSVNGVTMTQQNRSDVNSATFSRKPRRTTGGQTCTWPGCGRLFRHRNIYEEHQRLHELGIPVSQLRKCYMGARVKKTVREQLEELRTSDSVGDGAESEIKHKNRKRKGMAYGQESMRKRVTVKDRMSSFPPPQIPPPLDHQMQMQQPQIRYLPPASQPRPPVPGAGFPGAEIHSPRGLEAHNPAQQIANPGMVRYPHVAGSNAATNHHQAVRFSASGLPGKGHNPTAVYSPMNQPGQQLVNPVEQTLALLGIPTPVRRGEGAASAVASATMSDLSMDQIRRRLALRETSVGSQSALFTGGSTATPGGGSTGLVLSGAPAAAAGAAANIRPGTVMGLHDAVAGVQTVTNPRFFNPGPFPVNAAAPQVAANGIIAPMSRPIYYPGQTAGPTALNQGAQCS